MPVDHIIHDYCLISFSFLFFLFFFSYRAKIRPIH